MSQDCKNCKLSDEECSFGCVKSQDDLPTCNEGKRKSDVLLEAISKAERLQKQLDIAVKCLNTYANEDYWLYCCKACGGSYYTLHKDKINLKYGEYPAIDALAEIKELDNEQ